MSTESAPIPALTGTQWLIIIIASIGFLFDTYELLMTPLVAAPAIAELLKVPLNNPLVTDWVGRLLWIAALCGGVFGLLGGWLVDQLRAQDHDGGEHLPLLVLAVLRGVRDVAGSVRLLPQHDFHRRVRGVRRGHHLAGGSLRGQASSGKNGSASRRRSRRSAACSSRW